MALFSKSHDNNLWDEDPSNRCKAALGAVIAAQARVRALGNSIPALKKDMSTFLDNLDFISDKISQDPQIYRKIRPFTVVHLPTIVASLEALSKLEDANKSPERIQVLEQDIKSCLIAASHARSALEDSTYTALEIETKTLKQSVEVEADESVQDAPAGFVGRFSKAAKSFNAPVVKSISTSGRQVVAFKQEVKKRADAGVGLAYGYASNLVEDGIDMVTSPISKRMDAVAAALVGASASAIVGGLVASIVFPPAIPIAMGLALMDGAGEYDKSLRASKQESAAKNLTRQKKRSEEAASYIAKLKGENPVVRIETSHVHVTINSETGECQGIILTGLHAGESMYEIPDKVLIRLAETAPDKETSQIIQSFRERLRRSKSV